MVPRNLKLAKHTTNKTVGLVTFVHLSDDTQTITGLYNRSACSVRPKPGFSIGNGNQGPIRVLES